MYTDLPRDLMRDVENIPVVTALQFKMSKKTYACDREACMRQSIGTSTLSLPESRSCVGTQVTPLVFIVSLVSPRSRFSRPAFLSRFSRALVHSRRASWKSEARSLLLSGMDKPEQTIVTSFGRCVHAHFL